MKEPSQGSVEWYAGALIRAQRRRSPWNLVLIPLTLAGWFGAWYVLFRVVWAFHVTLYPQHAFRDFWPKGISFTSFVLSFLMLFAVAPGAMIVGFIFANGLTWLIPPARRVLDREAVGYPGTGFREATGALLKLAVWIVPAGLIIALIAAFVLRTLK